MASLGTLTAGVAHEINNPLAYMLSNLNYVSEELHSLVQSGAPLTGERAQDILEALGETLSGSTRVRDIVRDLRLFSRAPREQLGPLDLHTLLDSCVNMVWGELKHRGRLVKDYGDVPPLHGNESRLAQVFLNLIVNAVQALPSQAHETLQGPHLHAARGRAGDGGGARHGRGHPRGAPGPAVRAVLHHQARRRGHGAGAVHLPGHRHGAWAATSRWRASRARAAPSASSCRWAPARSRLYGSAA